MQANPPLPPAANRAQDNYSPNSITGSDWSGMNNYNVALRPDGFHPSAHADSMSAPVSDANFNPRPPLRAQTFGAASPTEQFDRRGPSENGSRASSRARSSRASDLSLRDPQSRRYQRAESELRQHYAVLRAYLKGGSAIPPRANKARDKLLRLSPVQFHELSTDVFDELQRRQAAQPLPGRPPRQDKVPPFLQPRPDFHEKRNQARQKLSSLQTARFRDLSTDVFCELERRFPHFNPENKRESTRSQSRGPMGRPINGTSPGPNGFAPPSRAHTTHGSMSSSVGHPARMGSSAPLETQTNGSNEFGRPMAKHFQSNTITPNKSTMVEDDEDDRDDEGIEPVRGYDRTSDAFGLESSLTDTTSNRDTSGTSLTGGSRDVKLTHPQSDEMQSKINDLEYKLDAKDEELKHLSTVTSLKNALEQKLQQADDLNKSLRAEIERMRQDHASQKSASTSADSEWRSKHDELYQQHRVLQATYGQQLKTTEEVSKQFKVHLADMRAMADENSNNMQREEQLHMEVQHLREESAEWKARYTKAKAQLKDGRISTVGLEFGNANGVQNQTFFASNGLVQDVHVTKFQLSIGELLGSARSYDSMAVLDHINDLVAAVRSITGDIEKSSEAEKDNDASRKLGKLKSKVSATANNVITATRNYAAAQGLSPVSLLDAAASHLTAAVVDLLKQAKICPSQDGELADDGEMHMTPVNKNGYFNIGSDIRRSSAADSIYSALSDPPELDPSTPVPPAHNQSHDELHTNENGHNSLGVDAAQIQQDDAELEELKIYLGNQTDVLVQNIQALVASIRNDQQLPTVRSHANAILDIADIVLAAAEDGMEQATSFQTMFINKTLPAFEKLNNCKAQFEAALHDSLQHDGKPSATNFSQGLPPLAFQIAREAKDLTARVESIMPVFNPEGEDFS